MTSRRWTHSASLWRLVAGNLASHGLRGAGRGMSGSGSRMRGGRRITIRRRCFAHGRFSNRRTHYSFGNGFLDRGHINFGRGSHLNLGRRHNDLS